MTRESASQTAGPYVHIGLMPNTAGLPMYGGDLGRIFHSRNTRGERLRLTGLVLDGDGAPVTDALLELWQADTDGQTPPDGRGFWGWGRAATDESGRYAFHTIRPGALPGQAPHITLWIVARGIGLALQTRVYFAGTPENETDPVLLRVPEARRQTLIARPEGGAWHMNIVLQGTDETVFLDI